MIHRKVDNSYTIWYCYSDENQKLGVIGLIERTLTQKEKLTFTSDVRKFFLGTGIHNDKITAICDDIKSGAVGIKQIRQFQIGILSEYALDYTHGTYVTESILSCPLRQYIEKRKFFVTWYGTEREIQTVIQTNVLGELKYD